LHIGGSLGKPFSWRENAEKICKILDEEGLERALHFCREMRRGAREEKHEFFKINGNPVIPASTLKGTIRVRLAQEKGSNTKIEEIFGKPGKIGAVRFQNAPIIGKLEWKKIQRKIHGRTITHEYEVATCGATFSFKVFGREEHLNFLKPILNQRLKMGAMKNETPLVDGSKTSFGDIELRCEG
jgi:hypothetical protein